MYGNRCDVVAWCENPNMRASLLGATASLNFRFISVSGLDEAREAVRMSPAVAAFVQCCRLCTERVAFIGELKRRPQTAVVVVLDSSDYAGKADAIRIGANACLGYLDVLQNVCAIVQGAVAGVLREFDPHLLEKRLLPISETVTLSIPGFCITGSQSRVQLPAIPGALLACLASRPNEVVSVSELVVAGWGDTNGATRNALHQQIYQLRCRLEEFGISDRVKSIRGVGVLLEVRGCDRHSDQN